MIDGRPVRGDYDAHVLDFVLGNEGFGARIYLDTRGVPTIGYGYALLLRNDGDYALNPELGADFAGIHDFSAREKRVLRKIAQALNEDGPEAAEALFATRAHRLRVRVDEDEAGALFAAALDRNLEAAGIPALVAETPSLAGSHELAAISDLVYQLPAYVGPIFRGDLAAGDRQQAWFSILTTMNRPSGDLAETAAIQERRIRDADEFGFLSRGDKPSARDGGAEAVEAFRFLEANGDALVAYFDSHGLGAARGEAFLDDTARPMERRLIREFGGGERGFDQILLAESDGRARLVVSGEGPTLAISGLGRDRYADRGGRDHEVTLQARGEVLFVATARRQAEDDRLLLAGVEAGGLVALGGKGRGRDAEGLRYRLREDDTLVLRDEDDHVVRIKDFQQGEFGIALTRKGAVRLAADEDAAWAPDPDWL